MRYKEFLVKLREEEWFQRFLAEELIPDIPTLETFNPNSDNTDAWKYGSGVREGYLLCLQKLGVKHGTGN